MGNIAALIQQLAGTHATDRTMIFDAEVVSVDVATRTCVVNMLGGKSSNTITARLMGTVDDGALIIPTVGTTVVCLASEYVTPVVIMYSGIDQIIWMGGEYEGVPIVIDPNDPNKGLLERINKIENILKDLIIQYNLHTHTVTNAVPAIVGTPVVATPTTQQEGGVVTLTAQNDISHPSITH